MLKDNDKKFLKDFTLHLLSDTLTLSLQENHHNPLECSSTQDIIPDIDYETKVSHRKPI